MMSGKSKWAMKLTRGKFDVVWGAMIVLGAASLVLKSHPVPAVPWLATATLSIALVIGFALTLFVERLPAGENERYSDGDRQDSSVAVSCKHPDQAAVKHVEHLAEVKVKISDIKVQGIAWSSPASTVIASEVVRKWQSVAIIDEIQHRIHNELRSEIALATREVFELYLTEVRLPKSRDVVKEAVEIAKHLQGTSLEVRVRRDGEIVISEQSSSRTETRDFQISAMPAARQTAGQLN
jgi:hypothetical protein